MYQRYWDKLFAAAGVRLQDQQEAEEALQDIFLNFWKRRERLELQTSFDRHFAVALKYEVINRLAGQHRRSERDHQAGVETDFSTQQQRFDLQVLEKELEHTICLLPPKCQLVSA